MKLNLKKQLVQSIGILLLLFSSTVTAQQTLRIEGVVKSDDDETLPGVSVMVQSSRVGTVTDVNGKFSISAPANAILIFNSVGFESVIEEVRNRSVINVTMKMSAEMLEDVVVVGYGQQTRKSLTSSITSIKNEQLNIGAISSPAQLLQGKVAGLNITRTGDPNATPTIILRGASTLREGEASQPLFVIDGVVGADIATVAPDNITGVDVLKDAAATVRQTHLKILE